jgi:hypothetical protein
VLSYMREPGSSRSNTRPGRELWCIETGGQVGRPCIGIIEHQHADKIPAFLLRFSHSGRKFIRAAAQGGFSWRHYSRWPDPRGGPKNDRGR